MPRIKVKKSGKWADPQPHIPQIEVEAGEEYDVSPALADVMVKAEVAEYVKEKPASKGGGKNPAEKDKDAADKGKASA